LLGQGPWWYREEYGGTCGPQLREVNSSPDTQSSEVLEIKVNIGVHTICQNEVSQLCWCLHSSVEEDRGETPAEAIPAAVAACLLPAPCYGLAVRR